MIFGGGLFGLIVLVLDIVAILQVVDSGMDGTKKAILDHHHPPAPGPRDDPVVPARKKLRVNSSSSGNGRSRRGRWSRSNSSVSSSHRMRCSGVVFRAMNKICSRSARSHGLSSSSGIGRTALDDSQDSNVLQVAGARSTLLSRDQV